MAQNGSVFSYPAVQILADNSNEEIKEIRTNVYETDIAFSETGLASSATKSSDL